MDCRKRRGMSASNQGAESAGASGGYVNCDIRCVVESGGGVPPDKVVASRMRNDWMAMVRFGNKAIQSAAYLSDCEAEV